MSENKILVCVTGQLQCARLIRRGRELADAQRADLLVLLSDIDGLYSEDPHKNKNASLIRRVEVIDDAIRKAAGGKTSALGTGGMATKIAAAELCMENGIDMIIMNGQNAEHLYSILGETPVGTLFCGKERS